MIEALGTLIIVIPILVVFALLGAYYRRKHNKARLAHSYQDIATKWHLWDEFVNAYHEDVRELRNPGDASKEAKAIVLKSEEMDYDTFYQRPTDAKIEMLVACFGEEAK